MFIHDLAGHDPGIFPVCNGVEVGGGPGVGKAKPRNQKLLDLDGVGALENGELGHIGAEIDEGMTRPGGPRALCKGMGRPLVVLRVDHEHGLALA